MTIPSKKTIFYNGNINENNVFYFISSKYIDIKMIKLRGKISELYPKFPWMFFIGFGVSQVHDLSNLKPTVTEANVKEIW